MQAFRASPDRLCSMWQRCPEYRLRYYPNRETMYETCHGIWNFTCPLSPKVRDADENVRGVSAPANDSNI